MSVKIIIKNGDNENCKWVLFFLLSKTKWQVTKNAVPNKRTNHEMGCLFNLPEVKFMENVKKKLASEQCSCLR